MDDQKGDKNPSSLESKYPNSKIESLDSENCSEEEFAGITLGDGSGNSFPVQVTDIIPNGSDLRIPINETSLIQNDAESFVLEHHDDQLLVSTTPLVPDLDPHLRVELNDNSNSSTSEDECDKLNYLKQNVDSIRANFPKEFVAFPLIKKPGTIRNRKSQFFHDMFSSAKVSPPALAPIQAPQTENGASSILQKVSKPDTSTNTKPKVTQKPVKKKHPHLMEPKPVESGTSVLEKISTPNEAVSQASVIQVRVPLRRRVLHSILKSAKSEKLKNSDTSTKVPIVAEDIEIEPERLALSKEDVLSLVHILPFQKYLKPPTRLSDNSILEIPIFEDDLLIITVRNQLGKLESLLTGYSKSIRQVFDLMTFPLNNKFEPLSRIKGILWIMSRSARIVRNIDTNYNIESVFKLFSKEAAFFGQFGKDFCKSLIAMIDIGKAILLDYQKVVKELSKLTKILNTDIHSNHHNNEPERYQHHLDPVVVDPVYHLGIDLASVEYFEKDQSADQSEKLSVEIVWTPSLTLFKSFRGKNWYCLQKSETGQQVKVLQANIQLAGNLLFQVKFVFENANTLFSDGSEITIHLLEKSIRAAKHAMLSRISAYEVTKMEMHFHRLLEKKEHVENFLEQLKEDVKWIAAILPSTVEMAPLAKEALEEFLEREHHICNDTFCECLPFKIYKTATHPFLLSNTEFVMLRIPLPAALLQGLFKNKINRHSNRIEGLIMELIDETQKTDFQMKKEMEKEIGVKYEHKHKEEIANSAYFTQSHPNIYNLGHVYYPKPNEKLGDDGF